MSKHGYPFKIQPGSPGAKMINMQKSLNHKDNARGRRRGKRFFKQDYDPKKKALESKKD